MRTTIIILAFVILSGCTKEVTNTELIAAPVGSQSEPISYAVGLRPATQAECSAGGNILEVFVDDDHDGIKNELEHIVSSSPVCNGQNGVNGQNGADAPIPAYGFVEAIFPCGNTTAFKEVLIRMQNGQVLASFSDNPQGAMTRLVLIPDGTYMNTDNSGCQFSLSTSADGKTRSISWDNQVQNTWSLP